MVPHRRLGAVLAAPLAPVLAPVLAVVLAVVLLAALPGVATSAAGSPAAHHKHHKPKPKPKPKVDTFGVSYRLGGGYHATTDYDQFNPDGYCAGTGFTEDVPSFAASVGGTVRLTVGKAGQHVVALGVARHGVVGTWSAQGTVVADGDECSNTQGETCGGNVVVPDDDSGASVSAGTTKTVVGFAATFTRSPQEASQPSDCGQDQDLEPPLDLELYGALAPWDDVSAKVAWSRLKALKVHQALTLTAAHGSAPSGYDVATCNHSSPCTGALTRFTHTIVITRLH